VEGEHERELIRLAVEGLNTGGVRDGVFHPEAEIVPLRAAIEATSYRGPDAPARFVEEVYASWSELRLDVRETVLAGDAALVVCGMHAVGRATGATAETEIGLALRFADGMIVWARAYADPAEARRVAGV
jgi:ketosteroid isomerase-like protein